MYQRDYISLNFSEQIKVESSGKSRAAISIDGEKADTLIDIPKEQLRELVAQSEILLYGECLVDKIAELEAKIEQYEERLANWFFC